MSDLGLKTVTIQADGQATPPEWALLQRRLIDTANDAADPFVVKYTRDDGTLIWRDEWPGMDGSDDPYEGFSSFPLLYALGGAERVHRLARTWATPFERRPFASIEMNHCGVARNSTGWSQRQQWG